MTARFDRLSPDKQRRILNAALSEFAAKGYRQASTDDIVAKAGISKGALFHYFGTKEKLYLYLLDWMSKTLQQEVFAKVDWKQADLFARLLQGSKAKLQVLLAYPQLWRFYESFLAERPDAARAWIAERSLAAAPTARQFLLEGIDRTRFRAGLDLEKMVDVVVWTFQGFGEAALAAHQARGAPVDLRELFARADEYVRFLETLFYEDATSAARRPADDDRHPPDPGPAGAGGRGRARGRARRAR